MEMWWTPCVISQGEKMLIQILTRRGLSIALGPGRSPHGVNFIPSTHNLVKPSPTGSFPQGNRSLYRRNPGQKQDFWIDSPDLYTRAFPLLCWAQASLPNLSLHIPTPWSLLTQCISTISMPFHWTVSLSCTLLKT